MADIHWWKCPACDVAWRGQPDPCWCCGSVAVSPSYQPNIHAGGLPVLPIPGLA